MRSRTIQPCRLSIHRGAEPLRASQAVPKRLRLPSSIDKAHFAQARTLTEDPKDQVNIPHPRLGFFGVIDERMDLELLSGIAQARPDWHLVIIGPVVK